MGFISKFFSEKENKQSQSGEFNLPSMTDEEMEQTPSVTDIQIEPYHQDVDELVVFSPYEDLIQLSVDMSKHKQLSNLSHDIGKMAYNASLSENDCLKMIEKISHALSIAADNMENMIDHKKILMQLKRTCTAISTHSFFSIEADYQDFLKETAFQYISDEIESLNAFQQYLPEIYEESYTEIFDFYKLRMDFVDIKNLHDKLLLDAHTFNETAIKLTDDINKYSIAVSETKAKNRLSVDWNGKKQPLMSMGQQLKNKREKFLEEEEKMNTEIQRLYIKYPELHTVFRNNCRFFVNELDKKLEKYVYDDTTKVKMQQLQRIHDDIFMIKERFEKFMHSI